MIPGRCKRNKENKNGFFAGLPESGRVFAIPYELSRRGIQRHGREGGVHQWALEKMIRTTGKKFHNVITVLIGGETHMAAIRDGRPLDVSDGFSAADGILSETGCGAVDSSIVFQLLGDGMPGDRVEELLLKQSGFKALAGGRFTLMDILRRKDAGAAFAREIFCYQILKYIGAFTAGLGGLDLILFIGEGRRDIRKLAFDLTGRLKFMGIKRQATVARAEISCLTTRTSSIGVYFLER